MKKCTKCGHENLDEARFCAECGFELNSASSSSNGSNSNAKSGKSNGISLERLKKSYHNNPICYICCVFPMIIFLVFSMAVNTHDFIQTLHPEDYDTNYPEEFNSLDINEDGKLEFNEVNNIVSHTPQETLYDIFKKSDKTDNGYLIGYEYDIFRSKAHGNYYEAEYRKELEEKEKERNASKYSSSSSNKYSNSLNNQEFDRSEGYVLSCPYCGSESVYEVGGYYRCAECGNNIYSPDELELGYWDGYME